MRAVIWIDVESVLFISVLLQPKHVLRMYAACSGRKWVLERFYCKRAAVCLLLCSPLFACVKHASIRLATLSAQFGALPHLYL